MTTTERTQRTITAVWEHSADEDYRRSQSHWRGEGRWSDDERWQSVGRAARQRAELAWTIQGKTRPAPLRVLEWGPGGGSLVYAFRDIASKYYGVDISDKNLSECGRMIAAEGHPDLFWPVTLAGEPHEVIQHVSQPIDLFVSNAVFQHFPSREYGADVLRAVRRLAAPGCVGAVQIRFNNGVPQYEGIRSLLKHGLNKYRGITRLSQYAKRHLFATSYRLDEFWSLLIETGWQPLAITRIQFKDHEADFVFKAAAEVPA